MNDMRSIQQGVSAPSARDEEIIDLSALLSALWRGKLFIFLAIITVVIVGGVYAYALATPMFQSTAVVMLNNRQETVVDRGSVVGALGSSSTVVRTEVEVLQGRVLLGKVVDELDLMQDPEFNAALRPPSTTRKIKNLVKDLVQPGPPQEPVPTEAAAIAQESRQREATINALLSSLTITNVPQSLVFEVTAETTQPEKSTAIADTLVDLYILNQLEVKFAATEQATSWLTERVADLQIALEEAENRVQDFRANISLISSEGLQGLEVQVKDLRDRIASTQAGQQASRSRLMAMRAAETTESQAEASGDLQLQRLLPRIDEPGIAEAFDTRVSQILIRLEGDIARDEAQLATLQQSLATLEAQSSQQSTDLITWQQLTREAEASRLLYEYFLGRLKETSAQQGVQQADSRILSPAVIPTWAASPRKPIILALSVVLGLIAGIAFVLLREARNRSFRNAEQLENATGYTAIGQVPMVQTSRRRKDAITYLKEKPSSAAAEAIRNLRTSVMLSNVDMPPKVLPGQGPQAVEVSVPGQP